MSAPADTHSISGRKCIENIAVLTEEMISLFPKEVDYTTCNQEGDEMVRCSNEYAGQQGLGIQFKMINLSHDAYLL